MRLELYPQDEKKYESGVHLDSESNSKHLT